MIPPPAPYTSVEVCAGAGGQALGLELAGFDHLACVEIDPQACATLRLNRPDWNVVEDDLRAVVEGRELVQHAGCDLLAGGVPCPPFSIASKQLGAEDERDLFPAMIDLVEQLRPRAVLIENVRGLLSPKFESYRAAVLKRLEELDYARTWWDVLQAADYGVPQLRPRALLVAFHDDVTAGFTWPDAQPGAAPTVGEALVDFMREAGWPHAEEWMQRADRVAPTLVGGSKKHGGPDLGPTRAKREWAAMGCSGMGVANEPPGPTEPADHAPKLTVPMTARLQGFPREWEFAGRKTAQYRQIGNAFPPPVAEAVGSRIRATLEAADAAAAVDEREAVAV
jgi:DNA (cytosine-5)-methyltransferase 1